MSKIKQKEGEDPEKIELTQKNNDYGISESRQKQLIAIADQIRKKFRANFDSVT